MNGGLRGEETLSSISDIWKHCIKIIKTRIKKNTYKGSLLQVTFWEIWLKRNNRIFNNKFATSISSSFGTKHMPSLWTGLA